VRVEDLDTPALLIDDDELCATIDAMASAARPGTCVFFDRAQVHLGWRGLDDCALTVLTTVVSRRTPERAVVDVGLKGLSSDPAPGRGYGAVTDRPGFAVTMLTEEHGVLRVAPDEALAIGAKLRIIPNHACVALDWFDEAWIVADGRVEDRWPGRRAQDAIGGRMRLAAESETRGNDGQKRPLGKDVSG
jgi:D-serine deaminase-like pyridoxal phosphate-dependent protein